jgi:curved DNA-binding protein CbpA
MEVSLMSWYTQAARQQMSRTEALQVFGLDILAKPSQDQLRQRYRDLALQYHPDKPTGDAAQMSKLNNAYEVLKNFAKSKSTQRPTQKANTPRKT